MFTLKSTSNKKGLQNKLRRRTRNCRGANLVEFSLIIPLFLLLFCGIADYGYMYWKKITINQAAREASRVFSVTANSISTKTAIDNATKAVNGYDRDLNVTFTYLDTGSAVGISDKIPKGVNVTTTVSKQIKVTTPIFASFFNPNPFTLKSVSTMEVEGQ